MSGIGAAAIVVVAAVEYRTACVDFRFDKRAPCGVVAKIRGSVDDGCIGVIGEVFCQCIVCIVAYTGHSNTAAGRFVLHPHGDAHMVTQFRYGVLLNFVVVIVEVKWHVFPIVVGGVEI